MEVRDGFDNGRVEIALHTLHIDDALVIEAADEP